MSNKTPYPYREVESRWRGQRTEGTALESLAEAAKARSRSCIYSWPAGPGPEQPEPSLERRYLLGDALYRFQRHRAQHPVLPVVVDGFAPPPRRPAPVVPTLLRRSETAPAAAIERIEATFDLRRTGPLVDVAAPSYYRLTQLIFLQLFLRGMVSRADRRIDICGRCGRAQRFATSTACGACGGEVAERRVSEWVVDASSLGDKLLLDLEHLDLTATERRELTHAIGRVRGSEVTFPVAKIFDDEFSDLTAFTTAVEQIFGVTFLLVDPYHPILATVLDPAYEDDLVRYRERLRKGSEPRISAVRTGGFALNPANLRRIPILASPLASAPPYGGVLMAVPAHDAVLFELARRQKLPIREVIHNDKARFDSHSRLEEPWIGDGVLTNSGPFTSQPSRVGRDRIVALLGRKGCCQKATRFRFSRLVAATEAASGPPVPLIHCDRCGAQPAPESTLPVEIPADPPPGPAAPEKLAGGKRRAGRAPCPACGAAALRDTHRLLPWLGTAWSIFRAVLPELEGKLEGLRDLAAGAVSESEVVEVKEEARRAKAADEMPEAAPGVELARERAKAQAESAPAEDVLPEDVDIFAVAAGGGEADGADPAGDADSLEAHIGVPQEALAPVAAAEETVTVASPAAAPTTEAAAPSLEIPAEPAAAPGSPPQPRKQGGKPAEADSDEPFPEEEEEEPPKLTALRPFAALQGAGILPADTGLGSSETRPEDLLRVCFIARFLHDTGHVPAPEPFRRYRRIGAVEIADPFSRPRPPRAGGKPPAPAAAAREQPGTVAQLVEAYGADAVRLALLAQGTPTKRLRLDHCALRAQQRFLERIWRQMALRREKGRFASRRMLVEKHQLIHAVTERLTALKPHTALAALARFVSFLEAADTPPEDMDHNAMRTFIVLLSPFAPFLARELWSLMGSPDDLEASPWPIASDELIHPPEQEFPIFVDGKLTDRMMQPSTLEPEKLESRALGRERIREIIGTRRVQRVVVVPRKLVNIVLAPASAS